MHFTQEKLRHRCIARILSPRDDATSVNDRTHGGEWSTSLDIPSSLNGKVLMTNVVLPASLFPAAKLLLQVPQLAPNSIFTSSISNQVSQIFCTYFADFFLNWLLLKPLSLDTRDSAAMS